LRTFGVLTRAFLKIAWRSRPSMRRRREGRPPSSLDPLRPLLYAIPQLVFAVVLLAPGPSPYALQALATLQFFLTVVGTLAMESDLVFRLADVHVLFHRPVEPRTYLAARFVALFGHMGLITVISSGPAAVVLALGFRSPLLVPGWILAMLLVTLSGLVFALLVLLPLLRVLGRRRVARAMPFVQAIAGLVFIVGYQFLVLLPRGPDTATLPLRDPGDLAWFPASWGAALARAVGGIAPEGMARVALHGALAAAVATGLLVALLGRVYRALLEEMERASSIAAPVRRKPWSRLRRLAEWATEGDPDARAGMRLAWALVFRAPDVRARMLPMLLVPIGVFAAQLVRDDGHGAEVLVILAPAIVANFSAGLVLAITRSRHHEARWIFDALPLGDHRIALRGACLAVLLRLGTPIAIAYGAASVLMVSPIDGLGTAIATFGLLMLGLGVGSQHQPVPPFSREPAHDAYEGCGTVFVMMLIGLVVAGLQAGLRVIHPALGLAPPVAAFAVGWWWWVEPLRIQGPPARVPRAATLPAGGADDAASTRP